MRLLVTGGGGFIGSHLVRHLLRAGHRVRVLDNFATGRRENLVGLDGDVELVEGDVQSYERAHAAVRECDVVLHQAALPSVPRSVQDPLTSNMTNVQGTLNVLLAARDSGVRRVVFASSSSVYGANPKLPKQESDQTLPMSPYAVAKLAGEGYCRSFATVYGLETVALRYFNVYGPGQDLLSQYAAVVPRFITAALRGTPPTIYGDGSQTRDFTYVDDVVAANLLAVDAADAAGSTMNVAGGRQVSLLDLWATIKRLTGSEVEPSFAPARVGDVPRSHADISLARSALAYEPRTPLEVGLERTIAHFRDARA